MHIQWRIETIFFLFILHIPSNQQNCHFSVATPTFTQTKNFQSENKVRITTIFYGCLPAYWWCTIPNTECFQFWLPNLIWKTPKIQLQVNNSILLFLFCLIILPVRKFWSQGDCFDCLNCVFMRNVLKWNFGNNAFKKLKCCRLAQMCGYFDFQMSLKCQWRDLLCPEASQF